MRRSRTGRRPGIALICVIVVLALVTSLMLSVTAQALASRRMLEQREHRQQTLWLARSGLDLAAAHASGAQHEAADAAARVGADSLQSARFAASNTIEARPSVTMTSLRPRRRSRKGPVASAAKAAAVAPPTALRIGSSTPFRASRPAA